MKSKSFWILLVIFVVGIFFRGLFLDKPCGLSYDELVSFKQAVQPNVASTIFYTLKTDVHMPLYQILLHCWCKIFSFSDIALRAFSALCGVLSVFVAYLIGKELKKESAKIICPALFAINSFFIYYSQEVRMYSLLIFFTSLAILFMLRIKNNISNKFNYFILVAICFALIHTYTIAFIYVVGLLVILFSYLLKNKYPVRLFLISNILLICLCLPTFLFVLNDPSKYTSEINGYYCDWSSLFIVIQDMFSPVLESIANNPVHYMQSFWETFSLLKLVFIVVPICLALFGIYVAIKKEKDSLLILMPAIFFFIVEIFAFKFTNFKILPRYMSLVMPAFLIVTAYGFSIITENKKINILVPAIFMFLNLLYMPFGTNSVYKIPRVGFKQLAMVVNSSDTHDGDFVLVWNRKEILDKYLNKKVIILSTLKDFAYRSETMLAYEQEFSQMLIPERKNILHTYFLENKIPQNTLILMSYIIGNMQPGQKFIITASPDFLAFDKVKYKELINNEEKYNATSLNDLLTIKSLTDIVEICNYNLKFVEKKSAPPYAVLIYTK